ncbi:phosphotransferase family protein [Halarchaeum sp. P4]|uniref:phosphotransferase family protein n=1 Tax=Halarchaeum sp. P4 TaxID=3421639 RepID=UPI003EBBE2B1
MVAGFDAADADPFDAATVRAMVAAVDDGVRVRGVEPIADGTDAVYRVSGANGDYVLKAAQFVDPPRFRVEPRLLALVATRTSIPVPSLVGFVDAHDELPAPFVLTEYVPEGRADRDLDIAGRERAARDAGEFLAELHAIGDFDAYGRVWSARDAERDAAVELPGGNGGIALTDVHDDWVDSLAGIVRDHLDELDPASASEVASGRFDDLYGDLADRVEAALERVATHEADPVLAHVDYRLGNLLLDADGATAAVLDWGNVRVTDRAYTLAETEQYLCGRAPHDSECRRRVRAALHEGYGRSEHGARYGDYLLLTTLAPLVWFEYWYADAEKEREAERLRAFVREL